LLAMRRSRLLGKFGGAIFPRGIYVLYKAYRTGGRIGEYKTIHWLVGRNARDTLPG
jgi:hypothetical protein